MRSRLRNSACLLGLLAALILSTAAGAAAAPGDEQLQEMMPGVAPTEPSAGTASRPLVQPISRNIHIAIPNARSQKTLPSEGRILLPTAQGMLSVEFDQRSRPQEPAPEAPAQPAAASAERDLRIPLAALALALILLPLVWKRLSAKAAPASDPHGIQAAFTIVRVIGEGGMGVVYEAIDRALERRVAIKKMRAEFQKDPAEAERFLKEARTVAGLHHPHIVDIYSIVEQAGETYLVFEYVEGKTLQALLRERKRFSLADAKRFLLPVVQALDFAHAGQIIHRDLKPANIMLTTQGIVKVMDFGIARRIRDALPPSAEVPVAHGQTIASSGTPCYMAPEAEAGVLCVESDVYSLGVILYEMLTGNPPFPPDATAFVKLSTNCEKVSAAVPGVPAAVDALIEGALQPDLQRRIRSVREFWQKLAAA